MLAALMACGGGGSAPGNSAPTVVVTSPAEYVEIGLSVGGSVTVTYTDNDVDDTASTDLVADRDGNPATTADQVPIELGRPEMDGSSQTVQWNVTGTAPGVYKVMALTSDGQQQAVGTAPGSVALNAPSSCAITHPAVDVSVSRGGSVPITYQDEDGDDVALTWLLADADGVAATTHDAYLISTPRPEQDGASQEILWNTGGVPPGSYAVLAMTWDGTNTPGVATAPGRVEIRNVAWARRGGGSNFVRTFAVASWADHSSVMVVEFDGIAYFGLGDVNETMLTSGTRTDVAVVRHNADGTLAWAKRLGGADWEHAKGVATFADGTCVVVGRFESTSTVFGPGEANQTTLTPAGSYDIFVAKYNANGTLAWVKQAGGTSWNAAKSVSAFADGSFVVAGHFEGTARFGAGEPNQTDLVSGGLDDAFVARYNADGTLAWAKRAGGADYINGLAVAGFGDGSQSCVMTGSFRGTARFGAGEPNQTDLVATASDDAYVARFNSDGTLAWVKRVGGSAFVYAEDIAAFADGTCVVTGAFDGTATFGPGEAGQVVLSAGGTSFDAFVARYGGDGTLAWVRSAHGGSSATGMGVDAFDDGSCVVAGHARGGALFGGGEPGATRLHAEDQSDAFVARYRGDGSLAWARRAGGESGESARGVTCLGDGSCIIVGFFDEDVVLGAGDPGETTLLFFGDDDSFIARYNADGGF